MNYIELYYADDYSLAEIAEEFGVSRQAVYDNIKRTEKILEDYETVSYTHLDVYKRQSSEEWESRAQKRKRRYKHYAVNSRALENTVAPSSYANA